MKHYIFLLLMLVTLFSCTKTIDFEDEELAHLAVVNGMIWPDQSFSVMLNQSTSILTDGQINQPLEGNMDLYEDGTLIRQLSSQSGVFSDDDIYPKAGKKYRVVISANGQKVEAETTIPQKTNVVSIDTTSSRTDYGSYGMKFTNYKLKIKDPEGEDYYRLIIFWETLTRIPKEMGNDTVRYLKYGYQIAIMSDDPVFKSVYNNFGDEIIDYGPENEYFIFPDTYFQGKEYTLQFNINSTYSNPSNPAPGGGYGDPNNPNPENGPQLIYNRATIHVQHLSKDFYNYLKYIKLYNQYHDNPFSEPIAVYSNVKNGAGIFGGFNDDVKLVIEDTYLPYSMDTIKVEKDPNAR